MTPRRAASPEPGLPADQNHAPPGGRSRGWWLTLCAYVLIFGGLLLYTHGLPYVIDNNESFASLVHARNLAKFDFEKSYGLTDESYAVTAAGHPYIHSHQGNFPRLFALLLHLLGARSIESQIWLTTFTVGLAAIGLAFRFARRLGGEWFGLLACLILMTDYALFTQWQVNTYRVWHGFFFFSSLECVHLAARRRWLPWLVITANFAALFYWEYVFGAFAGLTSALYALLVHGRNWRPLLSAWSGICCGGLAAATTLLAQLTAYMGWANVLRDIRYTLLARNSASDAAFAAEINAFYDRHNILFWQNFLDTSQLRSWRAAWQGVLAHHWEYSSPTLVALTLLTLAAWALSFLPPRRAVHRAQRPTRWHHLPLALAKLGLLALAMLPLLQAAELIAHRAVIGAPWQGPGLALFLAALFSAIWFRGFTGVARLRWPRLLLTAGFFTTAQAVLAQWPALASAAAPIQTRTLVGWLYGTWPGAFAVTVVLGVAASVLLLGSAQVLGRGTARLLRGAVRFLVPVFIAFTAVYLVFTGYIYSGYLHWQAPFLVFTTDLLLALAAGIGLLAACRLIRRLFRSPNRAAARPRALRVLVPAGALVAVVVFGQGWVSLQASYWRAAPPTKFQFVKQLGAPPYRDASFAVSTYAAPIAASTGSWAYFESTLFGGMLEFAGEGWASPTDHQYLWFADRGSNPAYRQPAYALNLVKPDNFAQALEAVHAAPGRGANAIGLFQRASTPFQAYLQHRAMATDGQSYAIVRLDWKFPPYLEQLDEFVRPYAQALSLDQRLAVNAAGRAMARRWRVEIEPLAAGDDALPDLRVTCDDRPVILERMPGTGQFNAVVSGYVLEMNLPPSARARRLRVTVNDATEMLDLPAPGAGDRTFVWTAAQPHGKHTHVPSFAPGFHVQTSWERVQGAAFAEVSYRYQHQQGAPEADTIVRLYQETDPGHWRLLDAIAFLGARGVPVRLAEFRHHNPDTIAEHARAAAGGDQRTYEQWLADHLTGHPAEWNRPGIVREALQEEALPTASLMRRRMPLPAGPAGRLQLSVCPGTRDKRGVEHFGLPFTLDAGSRGSVPFVSPGVAGHPPLPFGRLHLKLRFPANRWLQAEPIVTTGNNEAGDIVYAIYNRPGFITLGFDHWFKGGPITKPLPLDYDREHELEISLGSLFPHRQDVVFFGQSRENIDRVKRRVLVKLDGQVIIDQPADFYESIPEQATVGLNNIRGTSAGPAFTGEILATGREWPEIP